MIVVTDFDDRPFKLCEVKLQEMEARLDGKKPQIKTLFKWIKFDEFENERNTKMFFFEL